MGQLENRTAVITGGGYGIGSAVARRFAAEGARVIILGRTAEAGEETAGAIREAGGVADFLRCDVSDSDQVRDSIDRIEGLWGPIHALINCAAIANHATFLDIIEEDWDREQAINLKGSFLVSQAVARNMARYGGGAIVNFGSVDAHAAQRGYACYDASKWAILGLTRAAALDLAQYGIRVNSVSPGSTDSPMLRAAPLRSMCYDKFRRVPLGRLMRPEEIAAACLFLVTDESSGITGVDLPVDGGMLADLFLTESLELQAKASE